VNVKNDFRICRIENVVMEAYLGDEVVLLHKGHGTYYSLNSSGTFLWRQLDRPKTLAALADLLAEEYDVISTQARLDCSEWSSELIREGFLKEES
jgi:hypothetical protein